MLFQQADMEHIMEASTIRQLETISDAPNALEHAEGPCPTRPQLVFGAGVQRLRRAMEKAQPDPRTDVELHVAVVGVVVLRELLGLNEALTNLGEDIITTAEKGVRSLRTCCPRPVWQYGWRGTAVHHLKWRRAKSDVEEGIVTIFRPRQPVDSSARAVPCNTTQIHCDYLIDHLRLAICLGVERCAHAELDARHLEEVAPHVPGEHRVPITNDGRREPVKTDNAVEEGTGDRRRGVGVAERDEVRVLGEAVDDGEDD